MNVMNKEAYKLQEFENTLLSKLANVAKRDEILENLKEHFETKINSKRTFQRIQNFEDLFRVLRKRNVLSCRKIEPFKLTLNSLCDPQLEQKLKNFEQELSISIIESRSFEFRNQVISPSSLRQENIPGNLQIGVSKKEDTNPPLNSALRCNFNCNNRCCQRMDYQNLVMQEISERIGSKWRNLARYLNIREFTIDEIENKYNSDSREKAYQILQMSQMQLSAENWKMRLMSALENVRRKDLREWVEKNYENNRKAS